MESSLKVHNNLIPIVLGITGHRDIVEEDKPRLKSMILETVLELASKYPYSPFVLLSPLAKGADRLAAEALLGEASLQGKMKLIVPMPMEREEYSKDFDTPEDRAEFERLLEKAEGNFFAVPMAAGVTSGNIGIPENRDRQYAMVGAYIAMHSKILLALWDGNSNAASVGGTSTIVRFKRNGVPDEYYSSIVGITPSLQSPDISVQREKYQSILESEEEGPVYQIVTPRQKGRESNQGQALHTPFTLCKLYPSKLEKRYGEQAGAFGEKYYEEIFRRIDLYNKDVAELFTSAELMKKVGDNYAGNQGLLSLSWYKEGSEAPLRKQEAEALRKKADEILEKSHHAALAQRYAVAEVLAQKYQKENQGTLKSILFLATATVLSFLLYDEIWTNPIMLIVYLVMMGSAYLIHKRAEKNEYHNKYLDYRAFAEGLRLQFYWQVGGIMDNVSEYYLRLQSSELEWVRKALQAWSLPTYNLQPMICDSREYMERFRNINFNWIYGQKEYFKKTSSRFENMLGKLNRRTNIIFAAILITVLTTFAFETLQLVTEHYSGESSTMISLLNRDIPMFYDRFQMMEPPSLFELLAKHDPEQNVAVRSIIKVVLGILLAMIAIFEEYEDKMALAPQYKRKIKMSDLFDRAYDRCNDLLSDERIPEKEKINKLSRLLVEVGKEALGENGEWVLTYRERQVEPTKG